jgi:hypothetical protein
MVGERRAHGLQPLESRTLHTRWVLVKVPLLIGQDEQDVMRPLRLVWHFWSSSRLAGTLVFEGT